MTEFLHAPVLYTTVLRYLSPCPGEIVLDATLGLGGHAALILPEILPGGQYIGLDADSDNLQIAEKKLDSWRDQLTLHHVNFSQVATLNLPPLDMILADLGVSSPHFDDASRGFSFRHDGPLDMRLDRTTGDTAAQYIAANSEEDLAQIFYKYGELREAKKIARILKEDLPETTFEARASVERVYAWKTPKFLPQVFQALRIAVNDELQVLEEFLSVAPTLLQPGGRMVVISFHSLEDRLVKHTFRALTTPEKDPLTGMPSTTPEFELLTKKGVKAENAELAENPRARSAVLRAIRRVP